jgi:hypothetical protein
VLLKSDLDILLGHLMFVGHEFVKFLSLSNDFLMYFRVI